MTVADRGADAVVAVPVTTVWADPDAPREIDEPILRDDPDAGAWADRLGTQARLDLLGRSMTQALIGEDVIVLSEHDGWAEIRLPSQPSSLDSAGYPGWVRRAHLAPRTGDQTTQATLAHALTIPTTGGAPQVLSLGTSLPVVGRTAGTVTLRHPRGHDLDVPEAAVGSAPGVADAALAAAQLFRGMAYLWGGLSGWGVDCSGLVHLACRSIGLIVPRDAHDQARDATVVELREAEPGDAVYFEKESGVHHVGLVVEPGLMLHSPRSGETVRTESIFTAAYEGESIVARRLLSPTIQEKS